jgi:hypothetical protein
LLSAQKNHSNPARNRVLDGADASMAYSLKLGVLRFSVQISTLSDGTRLALVETLEADAQPSGEHPGRISKEDLMKRTLTVLTAAIFAGAMALPAFAQVGAGVGANVGGTGVSAGANANASNPDQQNQKKNPGSESSSSSTTTKSDNGTTTTTKHSRSESGKRHAHRKMEKKSSSESSSAAPSGSEDSSSGGMGVNAGVNVGGENK